MALADRAVAEFGTPQVWINNAGLTRPAMLHKMEVADFDLVLRVHTRGTFVGTREAARRMIAGQVEGVILNVTSSAGLQGTVGQINYAAAKGAITAMTKSAAKELARHGIRVNAVAPVAATPMTHTLRFDEKLAGRFLESIPLRRFGDPDEIAATFTFLASEGGAYMTGQVLCVDGGLYMAS
jgi:3-oxoacyl-[acyl-carrier protein] reductase